MTKPNEEERRQLLREITQMIQEAGGYDLPEEEAPSFEEIEERLDYQAHYDRNYGLSPEEIDSRYRGL